MKIKTQHVEYHPNGISGEGFFSVTFTYREEGKTRNMLGIVFDYDEHPGGDESFYNCRTAVLNRDKLVPPGKSTGPFGYGTGNIPCYRGDHFDTELRNAIREALIAHDVASGLSPKTKP